MVGTYSAIMVTNLSEASVGGQHLTENWVGLLGIVSSVATTAVSILAGKRLSSTLEAKYMIKACPLLSMQLVNKKSYDRSTNFLLRIQIRFFLQDAKECEKRQSSRCIETYAMIFEFVPGRC